MAARFVLTQRANTSWFWAGALTIALVTCACDGSRVVWKKRLESGEDSAALAAALARDDLVVVGGVFRGTLQGDGATLQSESMASLGGFVGAWDLDGRERWLRRLGTDGASAVSGVVVNRAGEVFAVGSFGGRLAGVGAEVSAAGSYDGFLVQLDPSDGRVLATVVLPGPGRRWVRAVSALDGGDLVIGGAFDGRMVIGSRELLSAGSTDGFVTRLAMTGEPQWIAQLSGKGDEHVFKIDAVGPDVAVAAIYEEGADWLGTTLGSRGSTDVLVSRLSAESGSQEWNASLGSPVADCAGAVALDSERRVWVAGCAGDRLDGEPPRPSDGTMDAFLASFDSSGSMSGLRVLGALGGDEGRALAVTPEGVLLGGTARGVISVDGVSARTAREGNDGFLSAWKTTGVPSWIELIDVGGEETAEDIAPAGSRGAIVVGRAAQGVLLSRLDW